MTYVTTKGLAQKDFHALAIDSLLQMRRVSVSDVRQEVLFTFREFRRDTGSTGSFLLRQFSRPFVGRVSSLIPLVEAPGTRFDSRPHTAAKA